jgi:hypothetical protein
MLQTQNELTKQPLVGAEPIRFVEVKMRTPALTTTIFNYGMRPNTGGAARTSRQGVGRQGCPAARAKRAFLGIEGSATRAAHGGENELDDALGQLSPGATGHGQRFHED